MITSDAKGSQNSRDEHCDHHSRFPPNEELVKATDRNTSKRNEGGHRANERPRRNAEEKVCPTRLKSTASFKVGRELPRILPEE